MFGRKRKLEVKTKQPVKKKIKKEPGVSCLVCEERFEKISFRDAHMVANHRPTTSEYGCSSCLEQFPTIEEYTSHHEWHSMFNVPHKCTLCGAVFEKLITFQRHVSACVHQEYALMTTFSKSIFCELCNLEYETQNLYDWHNCFIGHNSPCPKCERIFIKKTVLMKHMFKCIGPGSVVELPKKPMTTGKAKKRKQPGKSKNEIPPQNSVKFEPETIIEPADEAYDAMDDSYMDTHFGDSDNEFETNDSISEPTEPSVEPIPSVSTQPTVSEVNSPSYPKARKSTTCTSLNVDTNVQTNLNQPLLECRVKLEPLDVSNYAIPSTETSPEPVEDRPLTVPPLVISRPTVPPLTIRIKKEVIQPGYGDDFNPDLARNIKQERVDETYELAGTSRQEYSISHKKSKHREKEKKLYKKPALLAIKIKQERMEREDNDNDNDCENYYQDYSMASADFGAMSQPFDNSPLPIITQIHSVLEPPPISASSNAQPNEQQNTIGTNQIANSIPFVPIRIKSEFHKPLTPPPPPAEVDNEHLVNNPDDTTIENATTESQIINTNNECDKNLSPSTDLNPLPNSSIDDLPVTSQEENRISSADEINISPSIEAVANLGDNEQELSRIEPVSSTNDISDMVCERQSDAVEEEEAVCENISDPSQDDVESQNETIKSESLVENAPGSNNLSKEENQNKIQMENENLPPQREVPEESRKHFDEPIESRVDEDNTMNDESAASLEENLISSEENALSLEENLKDGNEQNSEVIDEQIEDLLDTGPENTPHVIKPICDDLDAVVTNEIMSPIDFIESNTNDDSLNFIDQLVHEVADTIVPQITDVEKVVELHENIQPGSSNLGGAQLDYNVGCSDENHENLATESNANVVDEATANDTLLALSDIDYAAELPPTLPKSIGSNGHTNQQIQSISMPNLDEVQPAEANVLREPEADPSKLPSIVANYQA